jgi:transcriptional regulator with XRE-family HTH domain
MSDFARRLKKVREEKGMTLYRLAQLTGLSKQGVINIERDDADPKLSTIVLLAKAMDVHPWVLMPGWPQSTGVDHEDASPRQERFAGGKATSRKATSTNGKTGGGKKKQPVGLILAHKACDTLRQIPENDPLRKRGFQFVEDWLKENL